MRMPKSGLTIKQLSLCWAGWHNLVPEYAQTTCDAVTRRLLYSIFTAAKNLKRSAPLWAFVLREHQSSTALSRRAGARASLELRERDHTRLPHIDSTKMAALLDFRGEQHHAISWADAPTITPIDAEPPRRTRSRTPPPRREPRPSRKSRRRKDHEAALAATLKALGDALDEAADDEVAELYERRPYPEPETVETFLACPAPGAATNQGAGARDARQRGDAGLLPLRAGAPRRSQRRGDARMRAAPARVARRRATTALADVDARPERAEARGALRLVGARAARRARVRALPRLPLENARRRDGVGGKAAVAEPLAAPWRDNI